MQATLLTAPLEALVNRNIAASSPARALLQSLAGRSFAVEVATPAGPLLRLRLAASEAHLSLATSDAPADAVVRGTPLGLAALLAARLRGAPGAARVGGTSVSGDAEVAESFERLLRHARPEFEEELARLFGDTPAHYAASAARAAAAWGRRALDSLARNVGEFLNHEGRDLVPGPELEAFAADVDRIRDDVERAAARLARLAAAERASP